MLVIMRDMRAKLTFKTVEHLTTSGPKRMDVWDTVLSGFGIRVSPSGRKAWFVVFRSGQKAKRITIGRYPTIDLAEARRTAQKIMSDAQLGRFDERPQAIPFKEAAPLFIELYAKPKNRSWRETERLLGLFGTVSEMPLRDIRRADIVRILDGLIASKRPFTANRALAAVKKLMSWSLDRGMIDVHPVVGLKPPTKEQPRDRILSDRELADLVRTSASEQYPFGSFFRMLVLTGQRRTEVSNMQWSEVDFDRAVWTIPAARSKNGMAHSVPLSHAALILLRGTVRFVGSDYVFTTTGLSPISGYGRAKARLEEALRATDWRTHDIRRTVASGMARLGIAPHVIEKVLNHKTGAISGLAAVYNRYGYETEKRAALEAWASHVTELMQGQDLQSLSTTDDRFRMRSGHS